MRTSRKSKFIYNAFFFPPEMACKAMLVRYQLVTACTLCCCLQTQWLLMNFANDLVDLLVSGKPNGLY